MAYEALFRGEFNPEISGLLKSLSLSCTNMLTCAKYLLATVGGDPSKYDLVSSINKFPFTKGIEELELDVAIFFLDKLFFPIIFLIV